MEQEHKEVEGQPEEAKAAFNPDELMSRIEKLEATNSRLLSESKGYKEKYQSVRNEIEAKEKSELESREEWKELLEKEREEKFKLNEQFHNLKKNTLQNKLKFEVAQYAKDAHSIEDIIRMIPTSSLDIDEDSLAVHGVKEAIDSLRKDKTYLFQSAKAPEMVSSKPKAFDNKKSLNEMNSMELKDRLKGALSQMM